VTRFVQRPDYEGAEFIDLSMASATFREVDLSGARMNGVLLFDADIDGAIERTAAECLRVILSDEWAHVQFANRDLAILEQQQA
jgi:uncharacterized protein YjbI with pentapeptide repeats